MSKSSSGRGKRSGKGTKWGGGKNIYYGWPGSAPDYLRRYGSAGGERHHQVYKPFLITEEDWKKWYAENEAKYIDEEQRLLKQISQVLVERLSCGVPVFIAIELLFHSILHPVAVKESMYSTEQRQILYKYEYHKWYERSEKFDEEKGTNYVRSTPILYRWAIPKIPEKMTHRLFGNDISEEKETFYDRYFRNPWLPPSGFYKDSHPYIEDFYDSHTPIHPLWWSLIPKSNSWNKQNEEPSRPMNDPRPSQPKILVWRKDEQNNQLPVPVHKDKPDEPKILVWRKDENGH